jgi:GT2 family glycosyltransferase
MTPPAFPEVDEPIVSVIVVTYGGWAWVEQALAALREHTDPVYGLIVVDNASPDGTAARLRDDVRGATVLFNDRNEGFGSAANQGVERANGRYVCFLNSDALVRQGWLLPLLETLDRDPAAGAAVPMLLNLDGTLQEAGALVAGDGVTVPLGFGADPMAPEFRFRRSVDYGSAACLVVRRDAFEAVGGFDPAYRMYYEDADLCFALAEHGWRTIYEPRSKVAHARWGSGNRATAEQHVRRSRVLFVSKWEERLADRPPLTLLQLYPHRRLAARDVEADPRVLVVLDHLPSGQAGSSERTWRTFVEDLGSFWAQARITVLSLGGPEDEEASDLMDEGIEVAFAPSDLEAWFEERRRHYTAVVVRTRAALGRVAGLLASTQPDAGRSYGMGDDGEAESEGLLWAEVALCGTESEESLARSVDPTAMVFRLPDRSAPRAERRRMLVDTLSHLGVPPPPA